MTEGRFETQFNLRPENWDNRRHWTNWHHQYDCAEDHLTRESFPFHDLRAGGQFSCDNIVTSPYVEPVDQRRDDGGRMNFAKGRGSGLGGDTALPLDTEPSRPAQAGDAPPRSAIFTRKDPLNRGVFSQPAYMPEGEPRDPHTRSDARAHAGRVRDPSHRSGIRAGGPCGYIGRPFESIPDPYNDKVDRGRIGRFKTGPVPHDDPKWMPNGEPSRTRPRPRGVFHRRGPRGFTIGGDPEWIPDPYEKPPDRDNRRPFRTWHTRTKWSMPVHAPWTTGLTTAEPRRGPTLDLTETNLPSIATYRGVSKTQTIGKEAALSTMGRKAAAPPH